MEYFLPHQKLTDVLNHLRAEQYRCIGPQVRENVIIYDTLQSVDQLPWGVQDKQEPGKYELIDSDPSLAFSWSNGISSLKSFLFKQEEVLWYSRKKEDGKIQFEPVVQSERLAFVGVKPCDVAALQRQDRIFLSGDADKNYQARRENIFIVMVNCTYSSSNCFCAATNTGKVYSGYDIAMTEISGGFVIHDASGRGSSIIQKLNLAAALKEQIKLANELVYKNQKNQIKKLPQVDFYEKLFKNFDHLHWKNIAKRCNACGNCTQVCPTCFCHKTMEFPSLESEEMYEHTRQWDSCFAEDHSYMHENAIHPDTLSRYRQWLIHKFGSWSKQFGAMGCVGCGRCITWCQQRIDVTEELKALCED